MTNQSGQGLEGEISLNRFGLDPKKPLGPQITLLVIQLTVIIGGPAIALITITRYPFLIEDRTLYIGGIGSIVAFFLLSFAFFGSSSFPVGTPAPARLMFRAGWGLAMTGWLLGISGIINGYATPLSTRDAVVVSKHQTLQRDPSRRAHYLAVRAWPQSRAVVELDSPIAVYDRLDVPMTAIDTPQSVLEAMPDAGKVRLIIGEGRLGLEWLARIELP